ncbi:MAG: hypothetical protein IT494_07585 [Gammaproteobacteria bacterium]|nr:hypothetical protein [Gammaproteobacteria bacterium]
MRRQRRDWAGCDFGRLFFGGCFALALLLPRVQAQEPTYTVLSPLGTPPPIQLKAMAQRLDTLAGKIVYIVDDGYLGGDVLLNLMVDWFEQNMPEVKAVYRRKAGGFTDPDPRLFQEIKANGAAMLMGMGH